MAVALCSETFQEFQMNKWIGRFLNERVTWIRPEQFRIALIGDRTSIGGSFLRNLLGENQILQVAESHSTDWDICRFAVGGVKVTATLVPALSDASGYKDEGYFFRVKDVESADLVIYCVDMSETRLRGSVLRTLQELKPDWSRTVIVLTFTDALPGLVRHQGNPDFPKGEYFNTKLAEWTKVLKAMLERIGVQEAAKIGFHPIGDKPGDLLPNGEPWLAPLSLTIMGILSPEKKAAFLEEHAMLLPTATAAAKQPATLSPTTTTTAELMAAMHVSTTIEVQSSSESNLQASSVLSEDQSQSIRRALSKLRKDCPELGILVIGRTGVGKSTLINNLLGKEVARVGHTLQAETPILHPCEDSVEGVPIIVYDTPGLGDVKGEVDEKLHLEIMKNFLTRKKIHLVVYCFQVNETIMTSSLVGALHKYHQIGVDWERSVIALTFADALYVPKSVQVFREQDFTMSQYFDERLVFWQRNLEMQLVETVGVKSDVVERLKMCPTSLLPTDQLPNGKQWYVPLWLHIVKILSPAATVRFLDIHRNNICDKQASPPSKYVKLQVQLSREDKNRVVDTIAVTIEATGMDSSEVSRALSGPGVGELLKLFAPEQAGRSGSEPHQVASPQNQTQSGKASILSQNVYDCQGHLMLLREHVSRKAAGKGRAVLEGLWFDAAVIEACFRDNPLDEEGAVQEGLTKWIGGKGNQPPIWETLLKAMEFAAISQQHVQSLKDDLGL